MFLQREKTPQEVWDEAREIVFDSQHMPSDKQIIETPAPKGDEDFDKWREEYFDVGGYALKLYKQKKYKLSILEIGRIIMERFHPIYLGFMAVEFISALDRNWSHTKEPHIDTPMELEEKRILLRRAISNDKLVIRGGEVVRIPNRHRGDNDFDKWYEEAGGLIPFIQILLNQKKYELNTVDMGLIVSERFHPSIIAYYAVEFNIGLHLICPI